jgi:hypothetical protein
MHTRQCHRAVVRALVIQRHRTLDHDTTARTRKVPDVLVDVSEEDVVTLVRVFGVIRIRHEVGILIRPERTVDGKVLSTSRSSPR